MEKPRFRVNARGDVAPLSASAYALAGANVKRDAARHDLPEFSGYRPNVRFAGTSSPGDFSTILGRARDLDENNGWVNGGIDRRVESVVGVNIRLSAQPAHELLGRDFEWRMGWTADVQSRFKVWANDIEHRNDARRRLTFGAQAKLAYLSYVRDGEVAAEIRDRKRGLRNTTNVLLVEPERIETPPEMMHLEGPKYRNGIEFDDDGAPVAYHIRNAHPNDPHQSFQGARYTRVAARGRTGRAKFLHIYSPRRIEQNRGISRLAEVMIPAKMVDRVDRAEVQAALKAAIFSIFIKSPGSTDDLEAALAPASDKAIDPWIESYLSEREKSPVRIDGASVTQLLPDEDVVVPNSVHPNANYRDFTGFMLQKVAGSLGVATPQLTGDYSNINYSSARALLNEIWRSFLEDRWFFSQHFLTPIYAAWLELEVALGDVKVPGGPANFYRNKTAICMAEWIGPGRGSIDPLKESNSNNLDAAAGRASTVEQILERGRDPTDVMAEESWWLQERRARGLSDPNYNVKAADAGGADQTGADGGGTAEDRDGDGKPNEDARKKKVAA